MNKKIILVLSLIIVILLVVIGYLYLQNAKKNNQITTLPTPTSAPITTKPTSAVSPTNSLTYCVPQDLQANIELSPGAGNVYGTFTLKNISRTSCQVLGNEFIDVNYDTSTVKNIEVTHIGQTQLQNFTLAPGQTLYSQVHYPNGPQCQSVGLNQTDVTFSYKISPTNIVNFTNQSNLPIVVQTCKAPTDMTEIQIWNMSTQPITQ